MTQHSDDKSPSNKVLLQTVFEEHARHLGLELEGGLKRQIRLLAEDFDDELASRAEDLLA